MNWRGWRLVIRVQVEGQKGKFTSLFRILCVHPHLSLSSSCNSPLIGSLYFPFPISSLLLLLSCETKSPIPIQLGLRFSFFFIVHSISNLKGYKFCIFHGFFFDDNSERTLRWSESTNDDEGEEEFEQLLLSNHVSSSSASLYRESLRLGIRGRRCRWKSAGDATRSS